MNALIALQDLLAYNTWANQAVLASLQAMDAPPEAARQTLAHITEAESTWLRRIMDNLDTTGHSFWPDQPLETIDQALAETAAAYQHFLASLSEADLARTCHYRNSKGVAYTSTYHDVLTHVLTHSAYHRGQIATAVRAAGGTPAYTDYIAWRRTQ